MIQKVLEHNTCYECYSVYVIKSITTYDATKY